MECKIETEGDVAVVKVGAESLDPGSSSLLKETAEAAMTERPRLVIDLSEVEFINSTGFSALLWCLRRAQELGGDVKLCGVKGDVRTLFQLIRMHRVFEIYESREAAVEAFRQGK